MLKLKKLLDYKQKLKNLRRVLKYQLKMYQMKIRNISLMLIGI